MIHYHGGPITPDTCAIKAWKGRHAFISYANSSQIGLAAEYSQSFAIDNGAFSFWKAGKITNWLDYYQFVHEWKNHPGFDFAVIPDVIDGTEEENDKLLEDWPFQKHNGLAVWHTNESIDRLIRLANTYPKVGIGSSGKYDAAKVGKLLARMNDVLPFIVDDKNRPICKLHGLRMLNPEIFSKLPLASADSTNVARNIGIDLKWKGTYQPKSKETRTSILVERIESENSSSTLSFNQQSDLFT
jgi:hypothetical protein